MSRICEAKIIDRGRVRISGTRITVYDVMDYYKNGWHRDQLPCCFGIIARYSSGIDYIEAQRKKCRPIIRRFSTGFTISVSGLGQARTK